MQHTEVYKLVKELHEYIEDQARQFTRDPQALSALICDEAYEYMLAAFDAGCEFGKTVAYAEFTQHVMAQKSSNGED
jgi:hypothetical protein